MTSCFASDTVYTEERSVRGFSRRPVGEPYMTGAAYSPDFEMGTGFANTPAVQSLTTLTDPDAASSSFASSLSEPLSKIDEGTLSDALQSLKGESGSGAAFTVATRLEQVLEDWDGEASLPFTVKAIQAFQLLLTLDPTLSAPAVGGSKSGELYARWKRSNDELVTLWFAGFSKVTYVVFDGRGRRSGVANVCAVLSAAGISSVDWMHV